MKLLIRLYIFSIISELYYFVKKITPQTKCVKPCRDLPTGFFFLVFLLFSPPKQKNEEEKTRTFFQKKNNDAVG